MAPIAAGCLDAPPPGPQSAPGTGRLPAVQVPEGFLIRMDWPTIINATPPGGEMLLRVHQLVEGDSRCGRSQTYQMKIRLFLFDRDGLRWEIFTRFPLHQANHTFRIPANGTPPYLLVGDFSACLTGDEVLIGPQEAYQPSPPTPVRGGERLWFNLTVAPGENRTKVEWVPGAHDVGLFQARPKSNQRRGEPYGEVHLISDHEGRVCTDRFSATDGWEADCTPFVLYPGAYHIVLDLGRPALMETTWTYFIDVDRFHEGVCRFGFDWPGLCV